ncbi:hypothetical protein H5P28_13235 [Ruficoccus amylovorans]|uniref:Uncharacterized protein n=1 Tax=Ruficoccus amylovorans TaxID=1804625 RepID=A0A842HF37_9BACT|nr:hypothetical protein [Ruficoccus amylovorans]MBC2595225.1 hypothetical protein [Ruficoccus amylovorans]
MKVSPKDALLAKSRRRGFALIVALALMSFIFLLIMSLTTLVRLESQVSATSVEISRAQQNALFGLRAAIGQLQEMAGPDQRVTGTAGLVEGLSQPLHANWTGVWDVSGLNPHAAFTEPAVAGWLVSGTSTSGGSLEPGSTVKDPILLVGEGSVAEPDDQVQAGRVAISSEGEETGHFAYWVADEGVKAKVNLNDPHRRASSGTNEEKRYSLMSAQRFGVENISTEASGGGKKIGEIITPTDETSEAELLRLASVNQLGVINSELDPVRKYRFHDLTTYGKGLLTNTAQGGLKKDLSLAFEMDLSDFNANDAFAAAGESVPNLSAHRVNYLFAFDDFGSPRPAASDALARGPTWHLLRNYYRLYKNDDPDRNQSYKTGHPRGVESSGSGYKIEARPYFPNPPNNGSKTGSVTEGYYFAGSDPVARAQYTNKSGANVDLARETDMPINPIVLREQFILSLETVLEQEAVAANEETGTPRIPAKYRLNMKIAPRISIWNPYNVKLEFDSMVVNLVHTTIKTSINVEKGTNREYELSNMLNGQNISLILTAAGGGKTTLEPGEIVIYAMSENTYMPASGTLESACHPYGGPIAELPGILFDELDLDDKDNNNHVLIVEDDENILISGETGTFMQSFIRLGRSVGGSDEIRDVHAGRLKASNVITWPPDGTAVTLMDLDADGLLAVPLPIAVMDTYLKPASDNEPVQFLTHYNPRASHFRRSTGVMEEEDLGEGPVNPGNWSFSLGELSSWNDGSIPTAGSWGDDNETGHTHVVLFEIPTLPMQSLAGFQHVNNVTHYAQQPAYPIGNSYANPYIDRESLSRTISATNSGKTEHYTQLDWSYLSNEALWDEYYFSTLVPRADLGMDDSDWNAFVTGFANGTYGLSNSRIRLLPGAAPADFVETVLGSSGGNDIDADAYEQVAASLAVDGAFNVNSTSVEAWKALLSATNGIDVSYLSGGGGSQSTASSQDNPYSRLSLPNDRADRPWTGFRALTEAQIEDLAEKIVEQVKLRGPFVSMADFVNRRLADDDTGLKGALQAAIDETTINNDFSSKVNSSDLSSYNIPFVDHAVGPIESGATGYLRQADLLQTLGPVLSARSDTFTIRAYGDSVNPVTGAEVRAWCEAVVQRTPQYVDNSNRPEDTPGTPLSADNERFGRRFEVVSFRWLGEDQI